MQKLATAQRTFLAEATLRYNAQLHAGSQSASSAEAYLRGRGLFDHADRYKLGVVADPMPGHEVMADRIAIPYLAGEHVVDMKFRCLKHPDCKAVGCVKYLTADGGGQRLYNARAVLAAKDTVVLTEGEFDAMAVSALVGIPAVGYPGTDTWGRADHWPRVFAGLDVVVVADGDPPGVKAAKAVAKTLDSARVVALPPGHDANSLILQEGADAFRARLVIE